MIWGNFSLTSGTDPFYNMAGLKWNGSVYYVDTTFPQIFNRVETGQGIPVSAVNVVAKQTLVTPEGTTVYYLVGGYNMQVRGDTSNRAYHLIRFSSDGIWDSTYSNNNPARALPGGVVNGINLYDPNFPNQARIFGTLPRTSSQGKPPNNDYMQLLDIDLSSILQHLGDDKLDGPIYAMVQNGANTPWVIWGSFKTAFETAINRVAVLKSDLSDLDNVTAPYASFNSGIRSGGGPNHPVFQGLLQGTGKVVLGGQLNQL